MSKLILALLLAAFAVVNFPSSSAATNYSEHKKFDQSAPTQRVPITWHGTPKQHPNYYCRDTWWEFCITTRAARAAHVRKGKT
jgi:hypothetical protein